VNLVDERRMRQAGDEPAGVGKRGLARRLVVQRQHRGDGVRCGYLSRERALAYLAGTHDEDDPGVAQRLVYESADRAWIDVGRSHRRAGNRRTERRQMAIRFLADGDYSPGAWRKACPAASLDGRAPAPTAAHEPRQGAPPTRGAGLASSVRKG